MGKRPGSEYQIDRINNNLGYAPGNCRWVTAKVNQRNRNNNHIIEVDGKALTVTGWAEELGVSEAALWSRLHKKWPERDVVCKPVRKYQCRKLKQHEQN